MRFSFFIFFFSIITSIYSPIIRATDDIEPVHYAFSNYLGSGIYRTSDQSVTLANLPFSYDLGKKNKLTYGVRLPVSLGFFDYDFQDIPELEFPDQVGTLTFTPGLSINYQMTPEWLIETYIDIGFARNFTTDKNVAVQSAGVSALYSFPVDECDAVWANRTYVASYNGITHSASDSYGALQSGIDLGLPVSFNFANRQFQPRIFASAFWYFSEVEFFSPGTKSADDDVPKNISLQNSYEIGMSLKVNKGIGYSWASFDTIGIGYRFTKEFNAVRLLFSMPI